MGGAIARRLLGLGYPLNVYNRSPGKTRSLARAGAIVHATPLKAARASDVIISVVTDAAAVRDVLFGAGGALRVPHGARLVIELGTHCPEAIGAIAAEVIARGVQLVEAPMTGSVHDALHGRLGFMVGADDSALRKARPLLEEIGRSVFHFGPPGAGNNAKLALNLLVGAMAHGLGEALALLTAQHLSVPSFLDALAGSGLASPLYRRIGERYLLGDSVARFSLANLEKDMLLVRARAQALGVRHAVASAVIRPLACMDDSFKQQDYSSMLAWMVKEGACTE